jgi:hypothetical protein
VRKRRRVQDVAARRPIGEDLVHQLGETVIVATRGQMYHLVDNDVLQAVGVLRSECEVEPDVTGFAVVGPPTSSSSRLGHLVFRPSPPWSLAAHGTTGLGQLRRD